MTTTFDTLQLPEWLLHKLDERGFREPTPVQRETIPKLLGGRDAVVRSATGTGKTLAYLLPIFARLDVAHEALQAVVLAPTRELAAQIHQVAARLAEGNGANVQLLIGGASLERQIEKLKEKPHLVVGTPGRMNELRQTGKLRFHEVAWVIADETDQLLDLGDRDDLEAILRAAPRSRRIGFFSATVTEPVLALAERWMREPVRVFVAPEERIPRQIAHYHVIAEAKDKKNLLARILKTLKPKAAIVFVNETGVIRDLLGRLRADGIAADSLFAAQGKQGRATVMQRFRSGKLKVLVSTDVAARGLDVAAVTHIIQFDPAPDADHYVHRSGRTGRMGAPGTVVSLVTRDEVFIVKKSEKQLGLTIPRKVLADGKLVDPLPPSAREAAKRSHGTRSSAAAVSARRNSVLTGEGGASERASVGGSPAARPTSGPARSSAVPPSNVASTKKKSRPVKDKNKGAPRWLKAKWAQARSEGEDGNGR